MPDLAGRKAFVTGAGGFIGANLCRALLRRGAKVHAMLRPGGITTRLEEILPFLQIHEINFNDAHGLKVTLRDVQPEYIFNLASPAGHPKTATQRIELLKANVIGTANLLEAILPLEFRCMVHFGSSTEYGSRKTALKENQRLAPTTFRGAAKAAAALLIQQYAREHQKPIVLIRPFSVYGYWEAPTRFIPTAILAALQGRELPLTQPGFTRDLIFVEDLIDASLLPLIRPQPPGKIFNVGSGIQHLNEQIVDVIESLIGNKIRIQLGAHPASPSDTIHWSADIHQAQKHLGWKPRYTLEEGMQKNIAWFRGKQDLYEAWKNSLAKL